MTGTNQKWIAEQYRYAEGKLERLPDLAAELVRPKVDVIVTTGNAVLAAKKAISTIPIVFAAAADPVGSGLVSTLARPGGHSSSTVLPDDSAGLVQKLVAYAPLRVGVWPHCAAADWDKRPG